jgi:serine/threonine protein kinase/predicted ATPase
MLFMEGHSPSVLLGHRYQLLNQLGTGAMGVVYRAVDHLTGSTVALKRVVVPGRQLEFASHNPIGGSNDFRLALTQEFRMLASLRHPNIISVLDYGFDADRRPYLVMELLTDAQPLVQAGEDLTLKFKITLLIQLLQALAYLHRRGILHRDLKPSNVLVSEGCAYLLDFGISIQREHVDADQLVGTLAYMAPEVLRGEGNCEQSDLYAVGVIAYELLTGKHPFDTSSTVKLIEQVLGSAPDLSPLAATTEINQSPAKFATGLPESSEQRTITELSVLDVEKSLVLDQTLQNNQQGIIQSAGIVPPANMLSTIVHRLLAKQPEARYTCAEDVIAALSEAIGKPVPEETSAIRESFLQAAKFVGREEELNVLTAALDKATDAAPVSCGSSWLVGGESGVGKSRLLDELQIVSLIRGVPILRGQGVDGGGLPYQLWREPLRRLIIATTLNDLEASVLKRIVPDIERLIQRDIPVSPPLDDKAEHERLVQTIVSVFRRQEHPLVLLLEDLQWASESLQPLQQLSLLSQQLPLVIVGTFRDDESPDIPAKLPDMKVLKLERLSETAVVELSTSMLGDAGRQSDVITLLQRETEGNVFFLVEVVRALAEEAGSLNNVGHVTLPQTVLAGGIKQIIQWRLERVPECDQPLLKRAAVAGRQIDLVLLSALADQEDIDVWLITCANVAVLEVRDGHWRFSHDKLREALLTELGKAEQAELHRLVAEAIETVYPDDAAYSMVLVEHWYAANNTDKALNYTVLASKQLLQTSAYSEAQNLIQRGLEHADQACQMELLGLLGETLTRVSEYDEALLYYKQGLALARELNKPAVIAECLKGLGHVSWRQSNYDYARENLEQSLALFREIGDQRGEADSLNHLAVVAEKTTDYKKSFAYNQQSLEIRRRIGDRDGIARSLNNLGNVTERQANYDAACDYHRQSEAICREIGDRDGVATSLHNLGVVSFGRGDFASARHYFEQCKDVFVEIGHRFAVAICLNSLGVIAHHQADLTAASSYYQQSVVLCREIGEQRNLLDGIVNLGSIALEQNNLESAQTYFQQTLDAAREIDAQYDEGMAIRGLGSVAAKRGDLDAAQNYHRQSLELFHQIGDQHSTAVSLNDLGSDAFLKHDYLAAQKFYEESLVISRDINNQAGIVSSLTNLAETQINLNDVPAARQFLHESMTLLHKNDNKLEVLRGISVAIQLVLSQKQHDQVIEWARALVHHGPYAFENIRQELESSIGKDKLESILSAELASDLNTVVEQILKETEGR